MYGALPLLAIPRVHHAHKDPLLSYQYLASVSVMTSSPAHGGQLLIGLRYIPGGVVGDKVQPLAPTTAVKRSINETGYINLACT